MEVAQPATCVSGPERLRAKEKYSQLLIAWFDLILGGDRKDIAHPYPPGIKKYYAGRRVLVPIRKLLVPAALKTLRSAGVFQVAANSARRRERLLILCYHGLSLDDEHKWHPNLYITPELFRCRLQRLRDLDANVLSLDEGLRRLREKSLPPRSVAITFDDGFYDFLQFAVPVLTEFSYPCTLYLTTHYCTHRLPVITVFLDYLLWKSGLTCVALPDFSVAEIQPIQDYAERQQVVKAVLGFMERNQLNTEEKHEVARQIAGKIGVDADDLVKRRLLQIMSVDEARQVAQSGIDIQLHTHRHRTPRDRDLFRQEIVDNRERILEITGKPPVHFCYPSGHHVPEFVPWLQELGVSSATTCERGLAGPDAQYLILPRVLDDMTMDEVRFDSFVSGLFA